MHVSILMLIASLFYVVMISILYFSKKRVKLLENKIYELIIINTISGIIFDICGIFAHMYLPETSFLRLLIVKLYLMFLLTYAFLLTFYLFFSNFLDVEKNKFYKNKAWILIFASYIICVFINFLLPFNYININNLIIYIDGPNAIFTYIVVGLNIAFWIFYLCFNYKKISKKKYFPLIAFTLIIIPGALIQMSHPEILIVTAVGAFVTVLMYHTIENPDMKMIEQLNIERDRADKANNAKSEFLSNMSHEIRTPLNAIVGFSQSLEDEDLSPDAKSQLKDIIMASDSLIELVNGILDISKIEANKLEIIDVEYNFKRIFEELCSLTKARMGDKGLDFRTYYDESIPPVLYGDQTRLKQIILNLLTNAVKYTKEGYVEFKVISVIKDNVCRLIISVEDSGIGIKKESIDKLFSKFERLGVEKNTTIEGTGLGLAITKNLVQLMGGNIVVQSEIGRGSRFTVAIDQRIIKGKKSEELLSKTQKIDTTSLKVADKKVLVVDDNILNLKVAERLLKKYNLVVTTVNSGDECLQKISSKEHFDLILLDDMMPKMSGVETLKLLKSNSEFNIPVVALTANAISGMKEKYLADGFDDYLSKPIELAELNRVIKKYLGN